MAPSKRFPKSKGRSKALTNPQTSNEYLEAADELERGGGKWKPGDATKAMRFYEKALAVYNEGLEKFPKDFDLAYNKAHLQYFVLTDAKLSPLIGSLLEPLQEALDSHRYAMRLDETNADILFNTAQVLTSLAEELGQTEEFDNSSGLAIKFLQEAIELFESCSTRQEMEFEEQRGTQQRPEQPEQQPSTDLDESMAEPEADDTDEWALITEPITALTLLETASATLSALTSLLSLYVTSPPPSFHASSALAALSSFGTKIIEEKLPTYLKLVSSLPSPAQLATDPSPILSLSGSTAQPIDPLVAASQEATLATALFRAALADAEYRLALIDAPAYAARLATVFASPANAPPSLLLAHADTLADFSSALRERDDSDEAAQLAWSSLERADECLAQAANAGSVVDVSPPAPARVYMLRGDITLARRMLALRDSAAAVLRNSAGTLLGNAGVYYRGAGKLAEETEMRQEAECKAWVVATMLGQGDVPVPSDLDMAMGVMEDMIDEELIEESVRGTGPIEFEL
ncbi:hypothetical protein BT63DRAFT_418788 [Microthyrium microscopicum]|uniref:TPR-like protein n=1 Tax=Microthyrium microscopicum TaxID=703497 RepID=A0A6A6TVX7_9PEZI|nr:hypothetical protein BT63DRAFT_418788 [Microthyrium microscopicum]